MSANGDFCDECDSALSDVCRSCHDKALAAARAQGVREGLERAANRLAELVPISRGYDGAVCLKNAILEVTALIPPDPMPGERPSVEEVEPGIYVFRDVRSVFTDLAEARARDSKPTPPPTRCDTDKGPCACGAWHGGKPAPVELIRCNCSATNCYCGGYRP